MHMATIGAKGLATTVARLGQGDRADYRDYLRSCRDEPRIVSFVDREVARRLDPGEQTGCMEMPAPSDPDKIPS
jgi:hypothetical protein